MPPPATPLMQSHAISLYDTFMQDTGSTALLQEPQKPRERDPVFPRHLERDQLHSQSAGNNLKLRNKDAHPGPALVATRMAPASASWPDMQDQPQVHQCPFPLQGSSPRSVAPARAKVSKTVQHFIPLTSHTGRKQYGSHHVTDETTLKQRLNNLPEITQILSAGAHIHTQAHSLPRMKSVVPQGQKNKVNEKCLGMQEWKKNRPLLPFPPCFNSCGIFEPS